MPPRKDITGQHFGAVVAVRRTSRVLLDGTVTNSVWLCRCTLCGESKEFLQANLVKNNLQSCGCQKAANISKGTKRHGMSRTPVYNVWCKMIARCTDETCRDYHRWGGRGIKVCDRWLNSFEAFFADMGNRPSKNHTIERKDNSLGYTPTNCVWDTRLAQSRNTRKTRFVTYQGRRLPVREWAEITGIPFCTLYTRIFRMKWPIAKAMTFPIRKWPIK